MTVRCDVAMLLSPGKVVRKNLRCPWSVTHTAFIRPRCIIRHVVTWHMVLQGWIIRSVKTGPREVKSDGVRELMRLGTRRWWPRHVIISWLIDGLLSALLASLSPDQWQGPTLPASVHDVVTTLWRYVHRLNGISLGGGEDGMGCKLGICNEFSLPINISPSSVWYPNTKHWYINQYSWSFEPHDIKCDYLTETIWHVVNILYQLCINFQIISRATKRGIPEPMGAGVYVKSWD